MLVQNRFPSSSHPYALRCLDSRSRRRVRADPRGLGSPQSSAPLYCTFHTSFLRLWIRGVRQSHVRVLLESDFVTGGSSHHSLYALGLQKRVRPPVASWYFRENASDGLRHLRTCMFISCCLIVLLTLDGVITNNPPSSLNRVDLTISTGCAIN